MTFLEKYPIRLPDCPCKQLKSPCDTCRQAAPFYKALNFWDKFKENIWNKKPKIDEIKELFQTDRDFNKQLIIDLNLLHKAAQYNNVQLMPILLTTLNDPAAAYIKDSKKRTPIQISNKYLDEKLEYEEQRKTHGVPDLKTKEVPKKYNKEYFKNRDLIKKNKPKEEEKLTIVGILRIWERVKGNIEQFEIELEQQKNNPIDAIALLL